jgi:carbamoyltransferase
MIILGFGGILSNAACVLMRDGSLVAAVEENKLSRSHVPGNLPEQAISECLRIGRVKPDQVDCVALARPFSEGPEASIHLQIRSRFPNSRFVVVEHHTAHAASAYFLSPFDDAVVLTLDRAGDFRCGARWRAHGNEIQLEKELYYPDSLGDLYGRVTELLGYTPNADEHKVQWLSTSGDDRFVPLFEAVLNWTEKDWPRLERAFFDHHQVGMGGFSAKFRASLGVAENASVPTKMKAHVAAGLQRAVERAVVRMAGDTQRICIAGGLGMNVLLVASLEKERDVFVQPAAGNAGTAIGAVLHAWHSVYRQSPRASLGDLCLGPEFSAEDTKQVLENCKLRFRYLLTTDDVIEAAIKQLNENHIVAWMHGRMEFGPRALGNRSILASPRNPYSTENLNAFIKHREAFRKFAASVPADVANEYFDVGPNARYLATVGKVKPQHRKTFDAAILGESWVRVHTVRQEDNPLYYRLLQEAGRTTGLPVLYNTSFNLFGDPLVCTPRDAARSFYSSGIDSMFVGHFLLQK